MSSLLEVALAFRVGHLILESMYGVAYYEIGGNEDEILQQREADIIGIGFNDCNLTTNATKMKQ